MDVLLINNYENINSRIQRLRSIVESAGIVDGVDVVHFTRIPRNQSKYSAIILSGSPLNLSDLNSLKTKTYRLTRGGMDLFPEMKVILRAERPILGICFGHQLIAYTYDHHSVYCPVLPRSQQEYHVVKTFEVTLDNDPLFPVRQSLNVDLVHNNYVRLTPSLQKHVKTWMWNREGAIQYLRSNCGKVFGVQFHPEAQDMNMFYYKYPHYKKKHLLKCKEDGVQLLDNFLDFANSYRLNRKFRCKTKIKV